MQLEFELNSRLQNIKQGASSQLEARREDRRDQRVNMQADRQKEMIAQRSGGEPLKKFESSGNDIITGDAGLDL